jgi:hypothetical protein
MELKRPIRFIILVLVMRTRTKTLPLEQFVMVAIGENSRTLDTTKLFSIGIRSVSELKLEYLKPQASHQNADTAGGARLKLYLCCPH